MQPGAQDRQHLQSMLQCSKTSVPWLDMCRESCFAASVEVAHLNLTAVQGLDQEHWQHLNSPAVQGLAQEHWQHLQSS